MINHPNALEAAEQIWSALETGNLCAPVRSLIGTEDLDLAYAIQQRNTDKRLARGERIVGAKIGLTSLAVQKQLGVDQPDFGMLTDAMERHEMQEILWTDLQQPKAEMEIAFRLGKDLEEQDLHLEGLRAAISTAMPAMEIVGSRIANWDIKITDTVADNASASHFVLGKERSDWRTLELPLCTMIMWRKEEIVSQGLGSACMGDPLQAALWLAKTMHHLGTPLKKDFVILAGALGPMVPVSPGDHFRGAISGFEEVSVSFAPQS
jgi:2-keto-4-pentenoate hydratase